MHTLSVCPVHVHVLCTFVRGVCMLMGVCAYEAREEPQRSLPTHCLHCLLRPSLSSPASPGSCLLSCCFFTSRHAMLLLASFCSWVWGTECCKLGTLSAEPSHQLPALFSISSQRLGQSTGPGAEKQVFSAEAVPSPNLPAGVCHHC